MHHSFLIHHRLIYLKLSLWLMALSLLAYLGFSSESTPNGGTGVGYGLGGLGTLLILWLLWLGVRKRSYKSHLGSVHGWLSAHVYLGIALVFIVTLHTGFQFGANIHTLAYGLMILVVASGVYGVYAYLRYPRKMAENQGGMTQNLMRHEIFELEQESLSLADGLGENLHQTLLESVELTVLGGSAWQQLRMSQPRGRRQVSKQRVRELKHAGIVTDDHYDMTLFVIADQLANTHDPEQKTRLRRLLELLGRKNVLVARLRHSIQYQALMDVWLYLHIPLSFGLLAALLVHILTVFLYW